MGLLYTDTLNNYHPLHMCYATWLIWSDSFVRAPSSRYSVYRN